MNTDAVTHYLWKARELSSASIIEMIDVVILAVRRIHHFNNLGGS